MKILQVIATKKEQEIFFSLFIFKDKMEGCLLSIKKNTKKSPYHGKMFTSNVYLKDPLLNKRSFKAFFVSARF